MPLTSHLTKPNVYEVALDESEYMLLRVLSTSETGIRYRDLINRWADVTYLPLSEEQLDRLLTSVHDKYLLEIVAPRIEYRNENDVLAQLTLRGKSMLDQQELPAEALLFRILHLLVENNPAMTVKQLREAYYNDWRVGSSNVPDAATFRAALDLGEFYLAIDSFESGNNPTPSLILKERVYTFTNLGWDWTQRAFLESRLQTFNSLELDPRISVQARNAELRRIETALQLAAPRHEGLLHRLGTALRRAFGS